MNKEEKIKYIESCYDEEIGKYIFTCECGFVHKLNIKQVWIVNMHRLKCKTCGNIIIK